MATSPGTMGGSSRILLRGINSISGDNQPLFVIDGVPIDNSNFNSELTQSGEGGAPDYGNAAQDINPVMWSPSPYSRDRMPLLCMVRERPTEPY